MFQYVGLTPSTQDPVAAVYDRRPLSAFSPREGEATSPGSVHDRRPRSGNRNDFRPPHLRSPISDLRSPGAQRPSAPRSPISDLRSSPRAQRPTNSRHQPLATRHGGFAAFTLIELLVVITIIAILAGLTLAAMGCIQQRGARAKAESDIQALSAAIEEFHRDFGQYPAANSNDLFRELTGSNAVINSVPGRIKVYFEPPPGIIGTNSSGLAFFKDPWDVGYFFSWNGTTLRNRGLFDLYSTAGGSDQADYIRN